MLNVCARTAVGLALITTLTTLGWCQEITESGKALEIEIETVLTGLYNPCGLAIRPGTEGDATEVFVSDSGALRIIKMVAGKPGESIDVVTGFKPSTFGTEPTYDIGPLGLVFLNRQTLVVGGGSAPDGEEVLHVYQLPDDGSPLTADQMDHAAGPVPAGDNSKEGEGDFFGLAVQDDKRDIVYVTSQGDDTMGWILKSAVKAGKLETLQPFIKTKVETGIGAPCGIAIAPKEPNRWLVVGQFGEIASTKDSLLTFYDPNSGELKLKLAMGLYDATGLAYSPAKDAEQSRLYAVDFAWSAPGEGGLFRLEAAKSDDPKDRSSGCFANKLVALDKPTSLAFAPDGTLYLTLIGTAEEGGQTKPGKLLKITGHFSGPNSKPAQKPDVKPEETPAEKQAEEPAEKPDAKPAEESGEKPAEEPAEKPDPESGEKPAVEPAPKPADQPAEEPAVEPEPKPAEEPAEKPAKEPGENP